MTIDALDWIFPKYYNFPDVDLFRGCAGMGAISLGLGAASDRIGQRKEGNGPDGSFLSWSGRSVRTQHYCTIQTCTVFGDIRRIRHPGPG